MKRRPPTTRSSGLRWSTQRKVPVVRIRPVSSSTSRRQACSGDSLPLPHNRRVTSRSVCRSSATTAGGDPLRPVLRRPPVFAAARTVTSPVLRLSRHRHRVHPLRHRRPPGEPNDPVPHTRGVDRGQQPSSATAREPPQPAQELPRHPLRTARRHARSNPTAPPQTAAQRSRDRDPPRQVEEHHGVRGR